MDFQIQFTRRTAILLLTLICLIGAWFRLYNLGGDSLWIDEGFTINAAEATLKHGYPILDSGQHYINGSLATYTVAIMMKLAPLDPYNPWPARIPAVLAGVGIIAAAYALGRRLFDSELIGFASALLVALMKWEIAWSRQARGYTLLTLFILLAALFLWRYLRQGKRLDGLWVAVFCIAAFLSHALASVFVIALFGIAIAFRLSERLPRLTMLQGILLGTGVALCTVAGFAALEHLTSLQRHGYGWVFLRFLFVQGPIAFSVGAVVGILLGLFDRKRSWAIATLASLILVSTVSVIGYSNNLQYRYLFPVIPLLIIMSAYAATRATELLIPRRLRRFGGIATLIILLGTTYPLLTFTPQPFYALEFGSTQPDFVSAYQFITPLLHDDDVIMSGYANLNRLFTGKDGL